MLEVVERITEVTIRDAVNVDDMQYAFKAGHGTTDTNFILRQIQGKYIGKNHNLCFAFFYPEKSLDRVPRKFLWWALRKVDIPECIVCVVQIMYQNARSRVRLNSSYSDVFKAQLIVHQGSVLSSFLFIIVMEAFCREFQTGCQWEPLCADDQVIIADTMDELLCKLDLCKKHLEAKDPTVNMGKYKV